MPEYLSGRKRKQSIGINSYSENTDTTKIIGNVLVSSGKIGIGTTIPTEDLDLSTIRVRDTLYDSTNSGGVFGYFLTKDNEGIKWVAVPPIDTNAIFVAENNNILGVSSFIGLNIVSDDLLGVVQNPTNPNFADIIIRPRWAKSGESGIYTTKNVGIGTTIPTTDFQVGFGTTGVTIDGSVGVVSALGYFGEYADFSNLIVGLTTITNSLNVIGLGGSTVSVFLASAGGITTTGGDLYVGGELFAGRLEIGDLELENINATGISTFNIANINVGVATDFSVTGITTLNDLNVTGVTSTKNVDVDGSISVSNDVITTNLYSQSGVITSLISEVAQIDNITSIGATIENLNASSIVGVSTLIGIGTFYFPEGQLDNANITSLEVGVATITSLVGTSATITNVNFENTIFTNIVGTSATITNINSTNVLGTSITSVNLNSQRANIVNIVSTAGTFQIINSGFGSFTNISASGIITAPSFVGNLTGNADTADYSDVAGLSTYAVKSGIATNVIGGIASVSTLTVSGISTLSELSVTNEFDVYANDSVFHQNVIIQGNLTVNGTEVIINVDEKYIKDKQIILGFSTTNNVNDTTANGGGIAIASTEGSPLVSLNAAGVNTLPNTYKQLIWTKSNTYGVGTTDAFLFNYAVGIGSTLVPNNVRLAVGGVQITDNTVNSPFFVGNGSGLTSLNADNITSGTLDNDILPDDINISGIMTALEYYGTFKGTIDEDVVLEVANYAKVAGVATYAVNAGISTNVIGGIGSVSSLTVSGITTTQNINVGTGGTILVTQSGNVGIGSTLPLYKLDVQGDVKINGRIIDRFNSAGSQGAVLTSDPNSSSWFWAEPPPFIIGILTATDDVTYYPTLRLIGNDGSNGIGSAGYLQIDNVINSGFSYKINPARIGIGTTNPQTNLDVYGSGRLSGSLSVSGVTTTQRLNVGTGGTILTTTQSGNVGIGSTLPLYKIDVRGDGQVSGTLFVGDIISRGTSTEEIVRTSSGIITTVNTNPITIDQFSVNSFRSAKYLVQVTTENSLGLGTTISVKNLSGGSDYFPGVYSDKSITSINGIGTSGRATITVSPQFTLTPTSCIGGTFTISGFTTGITTGQTIYFNEELNILPLEQSKLTQIQLNSSGFGYTTIPSVTIQAPIISSNPVPGVGTGATATAVVNSMIVQSFPVTVGISTTAYPTVTISSPTSGTTATGVVGVGVSTLSIVNVGSGYTVSPNISIAKASGFSGSVGLGISTLNWQTFGGSGFTTTPLITITGQNNIGVGASIEADVDPNSPNGLINFRITNVGSGYTAIPSVAITGDGVGAAVTITRMVVTDVTVNNSGSGSTTVISNSDIVFSPVGGIGTGAVATVNTIIPTNVVMTNVGSGYTSADLPVTATFSNPSIGATVRLGVQSISLLTTGIGYTVFPSITFASPTLGIGSTATASSTKLGYDLTTLFPGPGLGATTAVYYIQPVTNNTFVISQTKNGQPITLGYTVKSTTRVSVGGSVTSVNITGSGSGYESNNTLTALNLDSPRPDVNVGAGFSFQVNNTVNNFQVSDLLVLQTADTGNPASYVVESSGIADVIDLGDFTSDISGSNSRLRFTPNYSFNTIKYYRTTFTI